MKTIDNIHDAVQQDASKHIFLEVQIVYAGLVNFFQPYFLIIS